LLGSVSACSSSSFLVSAASGTIISWSSAIQTGTITAGNIFSYQPVLLLTDQYGDAVSAALISLYLYQDSGCSTTAGSVGLTGNTATTNSSGFASFTSFSATKAGSYYVIASYNGFNSSCSGQALSVTAASLAGLTFSTQPSGSVAAGSAFSTQPIIYAIDSFGNAVSVSITLSTYTDSSCSSAGSGSLSGGTVSTNSSGYAVYSGLSYNRAQTIYLKATNSKFPT
jgi:hypothetical protein